jgi:hypothetical protein
MRIAHKHFSTTIWSVVPRIFLVVFYLFGAGALLRAHTFYSTKITWSKDVSRIVYKNCVSCHHPGGSSFSLMTYKDARPWAEAIKQQVLERRMPPWNAVKGFGEFRDDRGLTQEDIEIIGEWVEGGMPEGNAHHMPAPPEVKDKEARHPASHGRLTVDGGTVIKHAVRAVGIEAVHVPSTGELQVTAQTPDGGIEPLIWIEKFNPDYNKTYYFREALRFPAGTRIEVTPREGSVALVLK